jgi:hypothetical protein
MVGQKAGGLSDGLKVKIRLGQVTRPSFEKLIK